MKKWLMRTIEKIEPFARKNPLYIWGLIPGLPSIAIALGIELTNYGWNSIPGVWCLTWGAVAFFAYVMGTFEMIGRWYEEYKSCKKLFEVRQ